MPTFPQAFLREVPDAFERLARLERLGEVPEDSDTKDQYLAQYTSWWGKRLDPKEFWKDRTMWLDRSASMTARRHGRSYPPIPYEDPRFDSRSDQDRSTFPAADSLHIPYVLSDKEHAFWGRFVKTHPQPPESIDVEQARLAHEILGSHYHLEHQAGPARLTKADLEEADRHGRQLEEAAGFPPEAFTDEALQWRLVLENRQQYERYVSGGLENTVYSSNFLARLLVDRGLVTDPLTDDQLKAADAWKIAYLQRLRREQTNESYIKAYLEAWKLSPTRVFTTTNGSGP